MELTQEKIDTLKNYVQSAKYELENAAESITQIKNLAGLVTDGWQATDSLKYLIKAINRLLPGAYSLKYDANNLEMAEKILKGEEENDA